CVRHEAVPMSVDSHLLTCSLVQGGEDCPPLSATTPACANGPGLGRRGPHLTASSRPGTATTWEPAGSPRRYRQAPTAHLPVRAVAAMLHHSRENGGYCPAEWSLAQKEHAQKIRPHAGMVARHPATAIVRPWLEFGGGRPCRCRASRGH